MKPPLFIALFAALAASCSDGGVTLTVHNVGDQSLVAPIVHVTGNSYRIGDLQPGQTKSVVVNSSGESHIEIEQTNHPRLVANCYFEPGYKGQIEVDVTADAIIKVKCDVKI